MSTALEKIAEVWRTGQLCVIPCLVFGALRHEGIDRATSVVAAVVVLLLVLGAYVRGIGVGRERQHADELRRRP